MSEPSSSANEEMERAFKAEGKYLYAIIRKPQYGKTFICIENIRQNMDCIHLVITMNTLKSNRQFFERAKNEFGNNICVLNSKGKKKDQDTNFRHAKHVGEVKQHLIDGSLIVIMCAHPKRFDESILMILAEIQDSKKLQKQVIIHIDEAHSYVPTFRDKVVKMNTVDITKCIYMYSATPFGIWTDNPKYQLFKEIYIVDCETQFNVIKSEDYFGVMDCSTIVVDPPQGYQSITPVIPVDFIKRWGDDVQKRQANERQELPSLTLEELTLKCTDMKIDIDQPQAASQDALVGIIMEKMPVLTWWEPGPFDLGNEVQLLSHAECSLQKLKEHTIKDTEFSYNFIPGFCRKLTHYMLMEMIIKLYPTALVIIINGDGTRLFRTEDDLPEIIVDIIPDMNESSEQIERSIDKYPNRPTFITGFHCVEMGVTLINSRIGNFDNVIYSHEHYNDRPDVHYQLCRFCFNYLKWKPEEKVQIKKTQLYVSSLTLYKNCLDYESQVDKIDNEMSGSLRTKEEVVGDMTIKEKKIPKELQYAVLVPYTNVIVKRVYVSDLEDEEEAIEKVKRRYKEWVGTDLKGKALPKKNDDGFYECSTTGKKQVFTDPSSLEKTIKGWSITSNFLIKSNCYKYARVYVAYDTAGDNSAYMWFIRMMEFTDIEKVDAFWTDQTDT